MGKMSKVSMINGELFMIQLPPEEVQEKLTEAGTENFCHFDLKSGETVYLQGAHVVSIESTGGTTSLTDSLDEGHLGLYEEPETNQIRNREDSNLEAAKEFKKDLDGNME